MLQLPSASLGFALSRPRIKIYQYAVKVIQGVIKPPPSPSSPIGPGVYFTSVSVHNPWHHKVNYAVKLAISGFQGEPGTISPFHRHQLGPDQATEYDQVDFGSASSFLDSYFVIESEQELDVVGVYTGAAVQDERLGAMHMERVPVRIVPRCRDLKMGINTGVAQWQIIAPVPVDSLLVVGPAPDATRPLPRKWAPATGGATWVGSSVGEGAVPGLYFYELSFCLCWTFQNAQIHLRLWADNQADLFLNGGSPIASTVADTAFQGPGLAVGITTGFNIGMNKLTVAVTNNEGPTGMLLNGTLSANAADCGS